MNTRELLMMRHHAWMTALAVSALVLVAPARAQDEQAAELAKKLSNPLAALISVPMQYNQDDYGGVNDGGFEPSAAISASLPA